MSFSQSRATTASVYARQCPFDLHHFERSSNPFPLNSFSSSSSYSYPSPLLISPFKTSHRISILSPSTKQAQTPEIFTLQPAHASSPPPTPPSNPLLHTSSSPNHPTNQTSSQVPALARGTPLGSRTHMHINLPYLLRTTAHEPSHDKPWQTTTCRALPFSIPPCH